jgi:amylosucrase
MVMLWSSLAEGKVALMTHALQQMPPIPSRTSWLTYVRCHDDIGWAVTEEDAAAVGLNGFLHRSFLSDYYSGRFPGTLARGATFQFNPRTNDRRISGSCASLAGLETALDSEEVDWQGVDLAIKRILLIHSMILSFGGIPLLYMGDEIGLLNDYGYEEDANLAADNRWLHRPYMDWQKAEERSDGMRVSGRIFQGLQQLVRSRKETIAFHAQAGAYPVWTHNDHVFGLIRESPRGRILVLGNFSDKPQSVPVYRLLEMGFGGQLVNLVDGRSIPGWQDLRLEPYGFLWLRVQ